MDRTQQKIEAQAGEKAALRTWTAPEAKSAEVAKATLGTGGATPQSDGGACAS